MNIILCYPPKRDYQGYGQDKRWLPLGIASLGAYIKKHNPKHNIVLLDLFNFSQQEAESEILKHVNSSGINLIGFTCFTEQRFSCLELCKELKQINRNYIKYGFRGKIYTALGGAHAQIMAEQIIDNYPQVDFIIKGEGEKALSNLVNSLPILTEEMLEEIRIIEPIMIDNIDEIPHAIEGFKLFKTPISIEDEAPIIFSRGCTDHCTFCSTTRFWKGYRSRSAANVFDEMLKYFTEYNISKFKYSGY
jgi:anaerobic magnesium-protoporphyrin IX monomethyl ester cyclase